MGDMKLTFKPDKRGHKTAVVATLPNGKAITDRIDLALPKDRDKFAAAVCKGRRGVKKKDVLAALDAEAANAVSADGGKGGDGSRTSQADKLVMLTVGMEFFHSPGSEPKAYASFTYGGHRETWPVDSSGFKSMLARLYFDEHEKAPAAAAVTDALAVLAGTAKFAGPEYPVAVRVAQHEERIYLDLCDEHWQAVEVDAQGWRVVTDPPVRFIRRRGMMPLPMPESGGSVNELRPLVNAPDDEGWLLLVAWLVGAFRPGLPIPILAVSGEQGSAKSTLCRMARRLIDPNEADIRRMPRDEEDLMIAAANAWILVFDNLSNLAGFMSDTLCVLSTGGGFATRKHYTNDEEHIFNALRPVVLNGINDVAENSDLIDRAIFLTLEEIDDGDRMTETELLRRFDEVQPRVLGALLTAVAAALNNLSSVRLDTPPRMADFAHWLVAAEPALPWSNGDFLTAYTENRNRANNIALDSSPVAQGILALMHAHDYFHETMKGLLERLTRAAGAAVTAQRQWPKTPKGLGNLVRRLAPNLRKAGIAVEIGERTRDGVPVSLTRTGNVRSQCSPRSQPAPAREHGERGEHHSAPTTVEEVWTA